MLLVMRGVRVWQNRQRATSKARRKGRGRQSLRHLGTCPQTMASLLTSLCPLPHCRCSPSSHVLPGLKKVRGTLYPKLAWIFPFLLLSVFLVPGKKSRVPEKQRFGEHLPMELLEQPVKKQKMSSSSKQQHAMGHPARSCGELFHSMLSGKQTCQQTGEEQKSSPPLQKELLTQPDNSTQEGKRLKLNMSCPQLKKVRECTSFVDNRLLFFLSCILNSHFVFTVSFISVLLNFLLPVRRHSFLSKSDNLSENWQTMKILVCIFVQIASSKLGLLTWFLPCLKFSVLL